MYASRKGSSRYLTIYAYVAKDFFFSFFVAFLFFFFIFFINQMLLMAEDILSKKAPLWDVILLVVYAMPSILAMSVPFASLVGALMAVGRFSSDNEIIVFQASGISLKRIFIPLMTLSVFFSIASFIMNDYFLPAGTINFGKLYRQLLSSTPALELKSYSVKNYQDSTIVTGLVTDNVIHDLTILDTTEDGKKRVIAAKNSILKVNDQRAGIISFDLTDVLIQTTDPTRPSRFEYSTSNRMEYNILLKNIMDSMGSIGPREMRSVDVQKIILDKQDILDARLAEHDKKLIEKTYALKARYAEVSGIGSSPLSADNAASLLADDYRGYRMAMGEDVSDRSLQIYKLEYYKKFSIPFASIFFVFFAFPVGLFSKRSGRSVGFGIGILVAVLYWSLLIGGQTFGVRPDFSPFLSMWLPDFLVLFLGGIAFVLRRIR
jgi:lipopolysaccharide export system permease protein